MQNFKQFLMEDKSMKALSIKQPWAWLIVNGHKDIENRTWKTDFRGELYIHAGNSFDKDGYEWVKSNFPEISLPPIEDFDRGGLIGKVAIQDCVTKHQSPWFEGNGVYGFVLENPRPIKFIPYKGQLKIFKIEV